MIRFINQPMLFSLLRDCCKTLSANWRSQCPSASLSISVLGVQILLIGLSHIPPTFLVISSSLSSIPPGSIRFTPLCPTKMDWPWKHPFCLHHHLCVFTPSVRGVSTFPLSPQTTAGTEHPIFSPAGVELSTLWMGLLRWSSCSRDALGHGHFSSFESVCLAANTMDFLSAP